MARHFNTAGPCEAHKHYMLPSAARLRDLRPLIDPPLPKRIARDRIEHRRQQITLLRLWTLSEVLRVISGP